MSEKLTKLVPVKLTETMHAELLDVCGGMRERAKWIRLQIIEGINRAKESALHGKLTLAEAKAIAEAHRLNIDPVAAIEAAIAKAST